MKGACKDCADRHIGSIPLAIRMTADMTVSADGYTMPNIWRISANRRR